ncbi:bZIP transcription factor 17-like [Solanum pennellii]|uniref:BZIP transcription factor 17-like n=1 Tax=Solanum pennellii TaxID=28526 RepID=A0ABM1V8L6_SOLPN|nr:bZIP transcription factor 17-like [Solanum pennellii]
MCTEVFKFDVSSSASDISMEENQNGTRLHRNRRTLNDLPASPSRPSHSISEEQTGTNGKQENKSLSSMVVSVLVDGDGVIGPKSVSRIFVVVLIDSVKYVTYSCMLPFKGSAPLVNAPEDGAFI